MKIFGDEIENVFQKRESMPSETLTQFLENAELTDHLSVRKLFRNLASLLNNQRIVLIIDEFDGIPQAVVSDFLYLLRRIYVSRTTSRSPYSLGIIGVKSITQLNYDRSISPFNIQDELALPNFTFAQVHELLMQYTEEVGQALAPEVIRSIHKQTAGQPFLVNRLAQILTDELDVPKTETLTLSHFAKAHKYLLREGKHQHLLPNVAVFWKNAEARCYDAEQISRSVNVLTFQNFLLDQ